MPQQYFGAESDARKLSAEHTSFCEALTDPGPTFQKAKANYAHMAGAYEQPGHGGLRKICLLRRGRTESRTLRFVGSCSANCEAGSKQGGMRRNQRRRPGCLGLRLAICSCFSRNAQPGQKECQLQTRAEATRQKDFCVRPACLSLPLPVKADVEAVRTEP